MGPQNNRTQLMIIVVISFIVVLGLFVIFRPSPKNKPGSGQTTTYNDPVSHQTITTQSGKVPEGVGNSSTTPLFAGLDKLLDFGVTTQQVTSLKSAFAHYKPFASSTVQISLAVDDVTQEQPEATDPNQRWIIVSHIVVNRKDTYRIKFYYSGLSAVQLQLYSPDNTKLLFDSGVVDDTNNSNQPSQETNPSLSP